MLTMHIDPRNCDPGHRAAELGEDAFEVAVSLFQAIKSQESVNVQEILPADWAEAVSCERSLGLGGISKRVAC